MSNWLDLKTLTKTAEAMMRAKRAEKLRELVQRREPEQKLTPAEEKLVEGYIRDLTRDLNKERKA